MRRLGGSKQSWSGLGEAYVLRGRAAWSIGRQRSPGPTSVAASAMLSSAMSDSQGLALYSIIARYLLRRTTSQGGGGTGQCHSPPGLLGPLHRSGYLGFQPLASAFRRLQAGSSDYEGRSAGPKARRMLSGAVVAAKIRIALGNVTESLQRNKMTRAET